MAVDVEGAFVCVVLACLQSLLAMAPTNLIMGCGISNGAWQVLSETIQDVTRDGAVDDILT